jgi:heme/copper-type cytochrome/quinol oxidase subunit 3
MVETNAFTVLVGHPLGSSPYYWVYILLHYKHMNTFEAPFTIADLAYGSTFFVATGFHELHVIIGITFLTKCLLRHTALHFSSNHRFGFEVAA